MGQINVPIVEFMHIVGDSQRNHLESVLEKIHYYHSANFDVLANEQEYAKFFKNSNTITYVFTALVTIISPFLLKQSVLYPLAL